MPAEAEGRAHGGSSPKLAQSEHARLLYMFLCAHLRCLRELLAVPLNSLESEHAIAAADAAKIHQHQRTLSFTPRSTGRFAFSFAGSVYAIPLMAGRSNLQRCTLDCNRGKPTEAPCFRPQDLNP